MMSALFAGVAGLRNHQVKMNVVGNNIANINTIGYKGSRATFQEALVQTLRGAGRPSSTSGGVNPIQMGLGMSVASIDNLFQQGGLETTGQTTDLAIQGNGFFVLSDGVQEFYSRAGAFGIDASSNLVDPSSGLYVQGKMANENGEIPPTAIYGNVRLPFGQQDPARPSTQIELAGNLDFDASTSKATSYDAEDSTKINAVTGTAKDGAGGIHTLTISGTNATQSIRTGTNRAGLVLTGNERLETALGVDPLLFSFTMRVDGGAFKTISLDPDATVNSLIEKINTEFNTLVHAEIKDGEVKLTRLYAGAGAVYNINTSNSETGNIIDRVFGVDPGEAFLVDGGADSSLLAWDAFVPSNDPDTTVNTQLSLSTNKNGFMDKIVGLGGGGVDISTTDAEGIGAGEVTIETLDTQHTTSITCYDSQGANHVVVFTFAKSPVENEWYWDAQLAGGEIITAGGSGVATFNSNGSLLNFGFDGGAASLRIDPNNGADEMNIDLMAGTSGKYDGLTNQAAASSTATARNQDGYGVGFLSNISIDAEGIVTGIFSNGVSRALAQITLADFSNPAGLLKTGKNLFRTSANSGDAIKGIATKTVSGEITSGALEMSNVDLAQEFTSMIIAQRGFQANARVITTSDDMLTDLVSLKR
ncbi:MAG: flagellar hook-basal body complex protein [candidate division Zixibacteria bacterium]|nr:flagellar hook-basal body complex protein [candidate division Zixibacteria bacterium]